MSFLRETDYHGSRRYDGAQSARTILDHLRLRVSLIVAYVGLQIEKLRHLGVSPLRPSALIDHGEKHFSLLGARPRAARPRRPITDIFPIPVSIDRPRKSLNNH
jgi:hypothetical protein